jgi:hypothetical protein
MMVIKGREARRAGVNSGRNDKGFTPLLPGRRTDGTQVGGTIPIDVRIGTAGVDGVREAQQALAQEEILLLQIR